ncbi:MAG: hypothetical protein ACKVU1_02665 [bacterium]
MTAREPTRLDKAIREARKRAFAVSESGDPLELLAAEVEVRLLDRKKDLATYAVRLADTLMRTAEQTEEQPMEFVVNSLGVVQGAGLDVDRACAEIAALRQMVDDVASARRAAERGGAS